MARKYKKSSKVFSDEDTDDSANSFLNLCESSPVPTSQSHWSGKISTKSLLYQVPDISAKITRSLQDFILDENRAIPDSHVGIQNTNENCGSCSNEQTNPNRPSVVTLNHEEIGFCDVSNNSDAKEMSQTNRSPYIDMNEDNHISNDDNNMYETIKFRGRRFRKKKLKSIEQADDAEQFPTYYSVEAVFPDIDITKRSSKDVRLNLPAIDISPSDQDNTKNEPRVSGSPSPYSKAKCVADVENNCTELEAIPVIHNRNNLSPGQASPELLTPSTLTPGNQSPLSTCSETSPFMVKSASCLVDEQCMGGLLLSVKQTRKRNNLLPPLNYKDFKSASQNREDDVKNNQRRSENGRNLGSNDKRSLPLHLIPGRLLRNNLLPPLRYRDSTSSVETFEQCDDELDIHRKSPLANRSKCANEKRQLSAYLRPMSPIGRSNISVPRDRRLTSIAKSEQDIHMLYKNDNAVGSERKRSSVSSSSRKSSKGDNSKKEKKSQRKRKRSTAETRNRNEQPGRLSNQCLQDTRQEMSSDNSFQSNNSISKSTEDKHLHAQRYGCMLSDKTAGRKYSLQTSRKKSFINSGKGITQQNNLPIHIDNRFKSENEEKSMNILNRKPPHVKTRKRQQFSKMISKDSIGTIKDSEHGSLTSKDSSHSSMDVNPRTPSSCGTES